VFAFEDRVHSEQFDEVLKKGKMKNSPLFSVCYLKGSKSTFAAVASKKVSKKAVIRNKNKRRVRHALKNIGLDAPTGAYVVFIKKDLSLVPYPELVTVLAKML
jgi:ribonuclease P protein component